MKKLIAMAVAILITASIAAFASGKPTGADNKRQFNYETSFSRIVVVDDIEIQLNESKSRMIAVTGNDADAESIDWKIRGNTLYLKSRKGSLKDKVKVSIDVNQLKEICIDGKSKVSSAGHLLSPLLKVFIDGDCQVAIKNAGQIYVENASYTEIEIKKMVGNVVIRR